MKQLMTYMRISVLATFGLGVVLTVIYPLAVWGVAQLVFPTKANGSLVERDGKVIGSTLLGQNFSSTKYFQSRPSAAGKGYDASNSGGSNLGPISAKFLNGILDDPNTKDTDESYAGLKQRVEAYRSANGLPPDVKIPIDAVTASGSGLDPHISIRNAELQLPRIARERGLSESAVKRLMQLNTEGRVFGVLGDPGVNVLALNLALDNASAQAK